MAGDVGVIDGRIVAIGEIAESAPAKRRIAANGLVVAPGFIDIHTHSDVTLLEPGAGINKVCQGVTTEVTGNCGFSPFPVADAQRDALTELVAYLGPAELDLGWHDFAGYASALQAAGPIQNVACLVGHGALRIAASGLADRPLTTDEQSLIARLLDETLEQGAFGFTSGLTYVPSMFAPTEELILLASVAADRDAIYATHARARAGQELAAIEEAIAIGRRSGARVQYSHLALNDPAFWGRAEDSLALFDNAVGQGIRLAFDVYPYDASASSITQYLPTWLVGLGGERARLVLADSAERHRVRAELAGGFYGGIPWMWDRIILTEASYIGDVEHVGKTFAAIADTIDTDPEELMLQLFERNGNAAQVALFYRTEADMVSFLRHPASTVGSDGLAVSPRARDARPHPRYYGTFPRVLGRYVREGRQLTLEQAIRKMTGEPADRLGLHRRGYLKVGYAADIVLFAATQVSDTATFLEPNTFPTGIETVIVNGIAVVEGERWNGRRAGSVLYH